MAYDWQTAHIPLAAGIDTKRDPRSLEVPQLAVAKDVQFDEVGGIQARYPYATHGSTLTNLRKIVANGDELLAFTKDALYTWDAANSTWLSKATYLAPKITEKSAFVRNPEQRACDRSTLSGVTLYVWEEQEGSTTVVKAAALDSTTGAVLLTPTTVTDGVSPSTTRPRVVALASYFVIFSENSAGDLQGVRIDPTALAATVESTPTTVLAAANFNSYYDVTVTGGIAYLAMRRDVTTSYTVASFTSGSVVATTTKARTCDGPIAISAAPNGTHVQIVRGNSTNIQGDYLSIAGPFTDVYTAQAVGTCSGTLNQIAAAHRSTTDSSQYRCYAFWSSAESTSTTDWTSKYNYVDTGNNLGTEANFIRRLGIASRAFNHDGRVYVWTAFAGVSEASGSGYRAQLQNTYFLYRDDATLIAKAASARGGGFAVNTGNLPNVQSLGSNKYAFCGVEKRVIPVGDGESRSSYAAKAPRDIVVEFDTNEARRCVRLGQTLYITGGEIRQWDGAQLTEVGFHIYPWYVAWVELASAGAVEDGYYAVKGTERWDNARGERDRSTSASIGYDNITAGPNSIQIPSAIPIYVTHKTSPPVCREWWRTLKNPTVDAPFYLISGQNSATVTGTNAYVANTTTAANLASFEDALADSSVDDLELDSEAPGVLENMAPPAASVIAASQDRVFLGGVAGDPDRVWYSKLREDGCVASFHDSLTIDVPPAGGDITAIAFLDETLVCFRETAIYALPGEGYDNTGGGQNYGPARRLASDVGATSAEAVAIVPQGIVFKSSKGWYILNRGGAVDYIGGPIASFDADTVIAAHVVESQHQVRFTTSSRMLVWDYLINQWAEWTISSAVSAEIWSGSHLYATSTQTYKQGTAYSGMTYGIDVETPWIKINQLQGYGKLRWIQILGEYRSAHDLRIRIGYNYSESDASGVTWTDSDFWSPNATTVGGPLQVRVGPTLGRCQSFKVRITAYADGSQVNPPAGEALKLTGLSIEYGVERGLSRRLASTQKT